MYIYTNIYRTRNVINEDNGRTKYLLIISKSIAVTYFASYLFIFKIVP